MKLLLVKYKDNWNETIDFLIDGMIRFEGALKEDLLKINALIKKGRLELDKIN